MANIFLISDTHFGHANILTFTWKPFYHCTDEQQCDVACKATHPEVLIRPQFSCVEEMDEYMVQRWNSVVRPPDHVYHLGDFAMPRRAIEIAKRLNGHKRITLGNHDEHPTKDYIAAGFKKILGSRIIDSLILTHVPVHPMNIGRFKGNIHGHIHQNPSPPGPYLNVSVEAIDYTPISLEDAKKRLALRQ